MTPRGCGENTLDTYPDELKGLQDGGGDSRERLIDTNLQFSAGGSVRIRNANRSRSIVNDNTQKRTVHVQPVGVMIDKSLLAKLVHEITYPGAGRTNHFRQGLLANSGDNYLRLPFFAIPGHQQECTRQTFFAGIKKLVGEIFFHANVAPKHVGDKEIGKFMLLMKHPNHFLLLNF